ncbi:DUF805 domain-containing protein [Xanthomonadaceae bacterium JHOS43]|nr:DUF805 domain-containing protein [Xanthomonadaceae bacterium JHOS43]MCX7563875.1 DUF805 domain-containing protein [Xanthomonadaceae bacterium XH05]
MDWGKFLLSLDGRIGRKAFWLFTVALIAIYVIAAFAGGVSVDPSTGMPGYAAWFWILMLVLIWPSIAVQAKRWHDQDRSAWWILINFVPFVGGLISLVMCGFIAGTPGPNRFGEAPMA